MDNTKISRFTLEIGQADLHKVRIAATVCNLTMGDFIRIAAVDHAKRFSVSLPEDNPFGEPSGDVKMKIGRQRTPKAEAPAPAVQATKRRGPGRPPKNPKPISYEDDIPEDDYTAEVDDDDDCGDPEELNFHD